MSRSEYLPYIAVFQDGECRLAYERTASRAGVLAAWSRMVGENAEGARELTVLTVERKTTQDITKRKRVDTCVIYSDPGDVLDFGISNSELADAILAARMAREGISPGPYRDRTEDHINTLLEIQASRAAMLEIQQQENDHVKI